MNTLFSIILPMYRGVIGSSSRNPALHQIVVYHRSAFPPDRYRIRLSSLTENSRMSSLQQALDNAANKFNLKKLGDSGKKSKGSGEFENCFAQGLDISELISSSSSSQGQKTSAAEELLKIKQSEQRQRQVHEEEEQKLHVALQKKVDSLKNLANTKEKEPKRSSFEIGDALLRMHGSDEKTASLLSMKATSRKGSGASGRRRKAASSRSNKGMVAKKSRKSKF